MDDVFSTDNGCAYCWTRTRRSLELALFVNCIAEALMLGLRARMSGRPSERKGGRVGRVEIGEGEFDPEEAIFMQWDTGV